MSSDDATPPTQVGDTDGEATLRGGVFFDVLVAIRGVTKDLLPDALREVRASNKLARTNQATLRILGIFLVLVVGLLGGCIWALWELSIKVQVTQYEVNGCGDKLDEVRQASKENTTSIREVQESAADLKEEQALQPRVEFVEEMDPVKARTAPIKVRVTQPARPSPQVTVPLPSAVPLPPGPAVVIEAPIQVKAVEVVPAPVERGPAAPPKKETP